MRTKTLLALLVGTALLIGVFFSVQAQETNRVYLPVVVGSGAIVTPPTTTPTATVTPETEPTATPASSPTPDSTVELSVSTDDKQSVKTFFDTYHEGAPYPQMEWTGNHDDCSAGTTSSAYRQSLQNLVNYYRAMAGVPADVTFNDKHNVKAQQAAMMMSVNRQLSHYPPGDWRCFTADGAEAARSSNLSYWYGIGGSYHGIKGQMQDNGAHNYAVGHRRWILCPKTKEMGTGDVPAGGEYFSANALWVFDLLNLWGPRPPVRDTFIAWPPVGYVPAPVVYNRWSFMLEQTDFSTANVAIHLNGNALDVQIEPIQNGYCENTLVWVPAIDWNSLDRGLDHLFQVEITGAKVADEEQNFAYEVIVFFP